VKKTIIGASALAATVLNFFRFGITRNFGLYSN